MSIEISTLKIYGRNDRTSLAYTTQEAQWMLLARRIVIYDLSFFTAGGVPAFNVESWLGTTAGGGLRGDGFSASIVTESLHIEGETKYGPC